MTMSGPRHMSRMIPDVAGKALGKKGLGYGKLVTDWATIVGADLGEATAPVKLSFPRGERTDATLTIDIVPARAIEVQHSMPQLIERVNAVFGYRAVSRIKLVQRPPARTAPAPNLRPLSLAEESELVELTQVVPDGDLRAALESLGRAMQGSRR
ncbi:MAG TPA: DciA family protein [Alphaproteobacteria bacterium]|nr:DciA family protein [Alphaproteobacteria bacterium]